MKFDRIGDVKLYLVGSVIMYKHRPVLVLSAYRTNPLTIEVIHMTEKAKAFVITVEDKLIGYHAPPLGYVNRGGNAVYLKRLPRKQYKKGVDSNNTNKPISHEDFVKMYNKQYPSLSVAMSSVENGIVDSCAFSPNFAIDNKSLYYKDNSVGDVMTHGVKLKPEFLFLRTKLKEESYGFYM